MRLHERRAAAFVSAVIVPLAHAGQDTTPPRISSVTPAPVAGIVDQVGLEQVAIEFDEPVAVPVDAVVVWTVGSGMVLGFTANYDVVTNTLTLDFDEPIQTDRVTVVVDYSITDMAGNPLDGDITDPANPVLPSGNSRPGGQAVFRINVLQGDANRDGIVDRADGQLLLDFIGLCEGDPAFDPGADLNADGCVNVLDVNIYQNGFGGMLPATDGQGPAIVDRDPAIDATIRDLTFDTAVVDFDEPIDPARVTPRSLFAVQPDGELRPADSWQPGNGNLTATFTFSPPLDQLGQHELQLSNAVADPSGELLSTGAQRTWSAELDFAPARIVSSSPANGESDVALTRETVIEFEFPLQTPIDTSAFFATFSEETIPALVHTNPDGDRVTLFYQEDLPPSALVRVTVVGDLLFDDLGNLVDADGDGVAGGIGLVDIETVTLTTLPGTAVCGRVFESHLILSESRGPVNRPLENVKITVDGAEDELFTFSDNMGNFRLEPAPVGTFFVHIDGRDVPTPDDSFYGFVGKPWTSIAGQEVNIGDEFLPLIVEGTLQAVSNVQPVEIIFPDEVLQKHPELVGVSITIPANSLFANDGTFGGLAGIAPVAPDRLPAPLPPGLNFSIVFTCQTTGETEANPIPTNFDTPVPVTFPNLDGLAPGEKSALWSFNHDTGRWEVIGPMTVTDDGAFVESDPGFGLLAPGWHGTQPGATVSGQGGFCLPGPGPSSCTALDCFAPCAKCGFGVVGCVAACVLSPESGPAGFALCFSVCGAVNIQCDDCLTCSPPDELLDLLEAASPILEQVTALYQEALTQGQVNLTEEQVALLEALGQELDDLGGGDFLATVQQLLVDGFDEAQFPTADITPEVGLPMSLFFSGGVVRQQTGFNGSFDTVLGISPQGVNIIVFDPETGRLGTTGTLGVTAGTAVCSPVFLLSSDLTGAPDIDADGLSDIAEFVVGTDVLLADTDGDGISDGAEVEQGTDPLDGLVVQTGIVGSTDTPGTAIDICTVNNIAIVADSDSGISVFNVFNGMDPTIIAQVETPGTATAVAGSGTLVAVADGSAGFAVIDISDPPAATIIHQLSAVDLGGSGLSVTVTADIAYVGTTFGKIVLVDLVTGTIIDQVTIGASIQDLAIEGEWLFALTPDQLYTLRLFESPIVVTGIASAPGSINVSHGRKRLYVGGGFACADHNRGFRIIDVTDPANPVLVNTIDNGTTPQFGWKQIVANGSGLGVATVSPNLAFNGPHDVSLYDLSDPLNPDIAIEDRFLTSPEYPINPIETPGIARGVSIFGGLAYVANHLDGLRVIAYQPYDTLGIPPVVSFAVQPDLPAYDEGSLVLVTVTVTDDVQVRDVELLIDDETVQTDGNFPYQFFFSVPLVPEPEPGPQTFSVTVTASDTGGNRTTAPAQVFQILADGVGPTVVSSTPGQGETITSGQIELSGINLLFSEPLDADTVDETSVTLVNRDDMPVAFDLSLVDLDQRLVVAVPSVPLGEMTLTLDGSLITDLAGTMLDGDGDDTPGGDFVLSFTVTDALISKVWIAVTGGMWEDPSNWDPPGVPVSTDLVLIDVPGGVFEITVSSPSQACASLLCEESLTISASGNLAVGGTLDTNLLTLFGGTLAVAGTLDTNTLTLAGGTLADATVVSDQIVNVTASSTLDAVTLNADLDILDNQAVTVLNGLTLHGTVRLISSGNLTGLLFNGVQTLDGSGDVEFASGFSANLIAPSGAGALLTIGPTITVHGQVGTVGLSTSTFINQGTIEADVDGGVITLTGINWQNTGVIRSTVDGASVSLVGTFTMTPDSTIEMSNGGLMFLVGPTVTGGALSGPPGTLLSVTGNSTLDAVTLNVDLDVMNGVGVTIDNGLTLNGTVRLISGGSFSGLVFNGEQTLDGSGDVEFASQFSGNQIVPNGAGAVLTIGPGITVHGQGGTVGAAGTSFINQGTIVKDVAGGVITLTGINWQNESVIQAVAPGAVVSLQGSWQNESVIQAVAPGAVVSLQGSFTMDAPGTIETSNGGVMNLNGATVTGGTLTGVGATVLSVAANSTLDAVTLDVDLDVLNGRAVTINNGLTLNGTVRLMSAGAFSGLFFNGEQTLDGTGDVEFASQFSGNQIVPNGVGAVLTIGPGIRVHGQGGTVGAAGTSFINQGTIVKDVAEGVITLTGFNWQNAAIGMIEAQGGAIVSAQGTWSSSGIITVRPGGQFMASTFTQESLGTLNLEIAGLSTSQLGLVTVSGTANFAGTLNLNVQKAYVPMSGDMLDVIIYPNQLVRVFDTVTGLDLGNGLQFDLQYLPTAVHLVVVPVARSSAPRTSSSSSPRTSPTPEGS